MTATNGAVGARGRGVDGARDQLLAGAGLAGDQHRRVAVGEQADRLLHLAHGAADADRARLAPRRPAPRRCRRPRRRQHARQQRRAARRGRSAWPGGRRRRAASPRSCCPPVGTAVSTATGGASGRARGCAAAPPCRPCPACAGRAAPRRRRSRASQRQRRRAVRRLRRRVAEIGRASRRRPSRSAASSSTIRTCRPWQLQREHRPSPGPRRRHGEHQPAALRLRQFARDGQAEARCRRRGR